MAYATSGSRLVTTKGHCHTVVTVVALEALKAVETAQRLASSHSGGDRGGIGPGRDRAGRRAAANGGGSAGGARAFATVAALVAAETAAGDAHAAKLTKTKLAAG